MTSDPGAMFRRAHERLDAQSAARTDTGAALCSWQPAEDAAATEVRTDLLPAEPPPTLPSVWRDPDSAAVYAMALVAVLGVLLLSGCVGMVNDYTTLANATAAEGLANTIAQRQKQNDLQLLAAEAEYCGGVSVGAVSRRYSDPAIRMGYEKLCLAVKALP